MAAGFMEVRLPVDVSWGMRGGPRFATDVQNVPGGDEQRDQQWEQSLPPYDISYGVRDATQFQTVLSHFYIVGGKANGFRLKDWMDYSVANQLAGLGIVRTIAASPTGAVRSGGFVTLTTTTAHGLKLGMKIEVAGVTDSGFNGSFLLSGLAGASIPSTTTVRYAQAGSDTASGGGTVKREGFQLIKTYSRTDVFGATKTHDRIIYKPAPDAARAVRVNGVAKVENTDYTIDYTTGMVTFVSAQVPADGLEVRADFEFDVPVRFDTDYLGATYDAYQLHSVQSIPLVGVRIRI